MGKRSKRPSRTVTPARKMMTFKEFIQKKDAAGMVVKKKSGASTRPKKLRIEMPDSVATKHSELLCEATRAKVGRITARRDPPHFQGDEYHGHAKLPGGYEASWNIS